MKIWGHLGKFCEGPQKFMKNNENRWHPRKSGDTWENSAKIHENTQGNFELVDCLIERFPYVLNDVCLHARMHVCIDVLCALTTHHKGKMPQSQQPNSQKSVEFRQILWISPGYLPDVVDSVWISLHRPQTQFLHDDSRCWPCALQAAKSTSESNRHQCHHHRHHCFLPVFQRRKPRKRIGHMSLVKIS